MGVNYAIIENRDGWLSDDFIKDLAIRKLEITEEKLEAICGRYSRGKRVGKIRHRLIWKKVVKGGWVKDGPGHMNGHVIKPGKTFDFKIIDFNGMEVNWKGVLSNPHDEDVKRENYKKELEKAFTQMEDKLCEAIENARYFNSVNDSVKAVHWEGKVAIFKENRNHVQNLLDELDSKREGN